MKNDRKVEKTFSICIISILLYALLTTLFIYLFSYHYICILLQIFIFVLIEKKIVNHINIAFHLFCNV